MTLKFTFLGTGTSQGVPVIGCNCAVCQSDDPRDQRLRTSGLFSMGDRNVVIDVGPDFRQQILHSGISSLEAIFLTHEHNDHVIGLDEVRPFNFMTRSSVSLYGEKRVLDEVRMRFSYIFDSNPYPGAPRVHTSEIEPYQRIEIPPFEIETFRIMHGYLPILGYKVGGLAYCTDTKELPARSMDLLKNIPVLVISSLHRNPHHSHLNLDETLELIRELNPGRAYLIHASHRMGLYEEVQQLLPENVFLGYDGMEIEVG